MNTKRTIALLPALILTSMLAACGQGNQNQASNAPAPASTAPGTDILAVDVTSPAIGHLVGDKQPGKGLVSNGQAGYLMFGQYFDLPAGDYRVTVHGTMQAPAGSAATFDVAYQGATHIILKKQVTTEEDAVKSVVTTLQFKLPQATKGIEVRALVPADAQMTLTGYTVTHLP